MAVSLDIRLFGPPTVLVNGEPLPRLKTRKGLWLLALLAIRRDRDVERTWLAGTLWPDADESTALTYLRQSLTDLRKALGPAADHMVPSGSRALRLDLRGAGLDVAEFDELIAASTPQSLQRAVDLYKGPLLEGCGEEWALQEREPRRHAWISALERLAKAEAEAGDHATAARRLRQVVSAEPLRESACRELMHSLAAQGEVTAATETYRQLRLLLRAELNADPDPDTRQAYEEIREQARLRSTETAVPIHKGSEPRVRAEDADQEREAAAARRLPSSRPARLPRYVSGFVGREREVAAIGRSLAASRLVTLTGLGGVGKTRLAVRVAELAADQFPDGVVFADLTSLTEAALVPGAVASALGIAEHPSRAALDSVAGFLEPRSLLLVLDNCEHVLAACVELASSLLTHCYDLKILATSRQRLRITGETEWRVPPLELPPEPATVSGADESLRLRQNDAVALFIHRAELARPEIVIGDAELRATADICRRLEGIPLALELAAARLNSLTLPQLSERLQQRYDLLVGADAAAPDRQQTLRAMLDWSYDLLTEQERAFLRRLSIFVGGWTLAAAEAVTSVRAEGSHVTPDMLGRLIDRSLIQFSEDVAEPRYTMLETVRQYGREKLARSGEEAQIRERHCQYMIQLAEEAERGMTGPALPEWLDRLEADHDNFRAALDACAEHPESVVDGLRLAGLLARFWVRRAHWSEGMRRYTDLLHRHDVAQATPERALATRGLGTMLYSRGEFAAARQRYEESLEMWRQLGDRKGEAETLTALGDATYFLGDYAGARQWLDQALALHQALDNHHGEAVTLQLLGNSLFRLGDRPTARDAMERAMELCRSTGDPYTIAVLHNMIGIMEDAEGNLGETVRHFEQALAISRSLRDVAQETICLNNLGNVNLRMGRQDESARMYLDALTLAHIYPGRRNVRAVACMFDGAATHAMERRRPRLAAWLMGAGTGLRGRANLPRPPQEEAVYSEEVGRARRLVQPEVFEHEWNDGAAALLDDAIERAISAVSTS